MELKVLYAMVAGFVILSLGTLGAFWLVGTANPAETLTTISPTPMLIPTPAEQPSVLGSTTHSDFTSDKLYSLINAYRREKNLGLLRAHVSLEQTAALKLADMQQRKYWTHSDPQGRESWYLFEQVGYRYAQAGENLSFGYNTAWQVFTAWQESPEHNTELLNPTYEHMGVAIDCQNYQENNMKSCAVVLHLGRQLL